MGILDEAIREHLELKRSRGATDSELQRLEDEAFGPPSRPGEPDFPEQDGEVAEQSGNGVAREEPVAEATEAPPPAEHDQSEVGEESAEDQPSTEGPQAEPEPELPADVGTAEAEERTALYDQTGEPELELDDLDLELDEEAPADEPPESEEQETAAPEVPIESLDTVEHPLPEEPAEDETDEDRSEEDEPDEDDDVLADTPEFLKDAPEDDELWFEQGKPKDFDF
jgi:hypothetical protein